MDVLQTRLDHRLQITYDVAHRLRLRAQTLGCGGPLRRARRCRGGKPFHLRNRLRYLFQALSLLLARPIHLVDQLLDIRCAVSDGSDHAGDGIDLRTSDSPGLNRRCYQFRGLPGGVGAALSQRAHLLRHYGESQTRFSGARRLHTRVESQQVRLWNAIPSIVLTIVEILLPEAAMSRIEAVRSSS